MYYIDEELKQNILSEAPSDEPARQLFFIEECRKILSERAEELKRHLTCCVNTFGCQMNAKDSEKLLGILTQIGYVPVETEDADFVLYNTCTVREHANVRVYGRLGVLKHSKDKNPDMIIALCGCMMQEEQVVEKIRKSYRHVNIIFGTHNVYMLAELLFDYLCTGINRTEILKGTDRIVEELPSERKYPFKCGINIMYGCNNFCSYCIVPYVRGRERSRRREDILREIRNVAAQGVIEVMLLGQNVNSYGLDFKEGDPNRISFPELLEEVSKVKGIERVRFMTPHPKDFSDELLETIAKNPKIARHIHLPLQSGNTEILRRMNRKYTKESYLELVDKIHEKLPDVAITTDIIVGFPGETESDVDDTIDVVKKAAFDNAFTFIYSKRTGTPAASFENQVSEEEVKKNFDKLLKVVQETARKQSEKMTGKIDKVLVESVNEQDSSLMTGRLSNNMLVHFPGDESLIGSFVDVSLDECKGFYFMGHIV